MPKLDEVKPFARVRNAKRGHYDAKTIAAILDAGMVGHLGFIADGRPMVIPTIFARDGDRLYLHGSSKTRFVKLCREQAPIVFTVTLLDAIVAARSAFHHSFNYRSVVVHGAARLVSDPGERERALNLLTEHILPGRYTEVRPMLEKERKATGVIALEIEAASAKVRQGPPIDDPLDRDLPQWSGILPITTTIGRGVPGDASSAETSEPASFERARKRFAS